MYLAAEPSIMPTSSYNNVNLSGQTLKGMYVRLAQCLCFTPRLYGSNRSIYPSKG